jgi:2,3-dihydroxy-p-cumate/2,3-dihydroxybenzoate 3,4-dioxygenase
MRLQSVELRVADPARAAEFFEQLWGLTSAGIDGATRFFRGTAGLPHVIALSPGEPSLRSVTFCGTPAELEQTAARARRHGALFSSKDSVVISGPEDQTYRFVVEAPAAALAADRDCPVQLSHVVLNANDADTAERFAVEALGFRLTDRTRHMTFVRCNRTHHCIAYARAGYSSLNHIAFEMRDLDAVMRGISRLRDAGYECVWGPGRHGPGHNVFGYFVAPFGAIIEYTAEVEEVGDDYRVGGPEDWKWPAGRIDHWGLSKKNTELTGAAERKFRWSNAV